MTVGCCLVIICYDSRASGIAARLAKLPELTIYAILTPIGQAPSERKWVGQICNGVEIISLVARFVFATNVDVKC